jgi:hypothetical protein
MAKAKAKSLIVQDFDCMTDLVKVARINPYHAGQTECAAWYGTSTNEEGFALALTGWSEPGDDVRRLSGVIMGSLAEALPEHHIVQHDVTGACVDIGAFLSGEPECMMDFVMEPVSTHGKVITVLCGVTVNADSSGDDIRRRGAAICALVESLTMMGHSVRVIAEFSCANLYEGGTLSQTVTIKSATDPMDIDQVMFALAHPAMLRRVFFGAMRSAPGNFDPDNCSARPTTQGERFGADVVIDVQRSDGVRRLVSDPEGWIKDTLADLGLELEGGV